MKINYLRISVTDRCNLRCIYCEPFRDCTFINRSEVLRFEEIIRIVRQFAEFGIDKIRITGGEPLLRKDLPALVNEISKIEKIKEICLTTNGVLLKQMADDLKDAGLTRVNVSVDSAQRGNFKQITGFDLLEKVTGGIYRAIQAGLTPLKINSVIIRGVNESQVVALAELSVKLPVMVRFIEYCPTEKHIRPADDYIPNGIIKEKIERKFGLSSVSEQSICDPASYFKIPNSAGLVGFINGRSSVFCSSCNRLRLTSDGQLKPCLYSTGFYNLKEMIRSGASDDRLRDTIEKIINEKGNFTKLSSSGNFSMRKIGG